MHHTKNQFEYNQITDHIYLGTNQCCQSHFSKELLEKGITADISLEEEHVDTPYGVEMYLWLPVKDHMPPSHDQLDLGVAAIQKIISQGKKVYIHCKNGHGRGPTLLAAYLIKDNMAAEEAISFIKSRRPSIHLEGTQIKALKEFVEKRC